MFFQKQACGNFQQNQLSEEGKLHEIYKEKAAELRKMSAKVMVSITFSAQNMNFTVFVFVLVLLRRICHGTVEIHSVAEIFLSCAFH
jgi:hypothetical protein